MPTNGPRNIANRRAPWKANNPTTNISRTGRSFFQWKKKKIRKPTKPTAESVGDVVRWPKVVLAGSVLVSLIVFNTFGMATLSPLGNTGSSLSCT